jgi:hypothetical protein
MHTGAGVQPRSDLALTGTDLGVFRAPHSHFKTTIMNIRSCSALLAIGATILGQIQAAPYATTQFASTVTGTDALLRGMVTPNGADTTAWFEWGTNTSYGNQTAPTRVGDSTNVVPITAAINALILHTAYHYRVVASNAFAVTYGAHRIFAVGNSVMAWGRNAEGETNVPAALTDVVNLSGAWWHSLAVKSDGSVVAWGSVWSGETDVPSGLSDVVQVAGGANHSLALKSDGSVITWGEFQQPSGLSNVFAIASGGYHGLALHTDGSIFTWGQAETIELKNVVGITGGRSFSLALKNDGTVVAWGTNNFGQTNVPENLRQVVAIAAGAGSSLALTSDGHVVAWGDNSSGQTNVPSLSNVIAIAAGGNHCLALKSDMTVTAWGADWDGQSDVSPNLKNVVDVQAGESHSLVLIASEGLVPARTATANAVVVNGFVVGANLIDRGFGYTNTPTVRMIGGSGTGAQAVAVVTNGIVTAVKVVDAGSGYTNAPVIVIAPPFIPQPVIGITALLYGPLVPPVMKLDFTRLSPYDDYQLEFSPVATGTWTNVGAPFVPTAVTNTQYTSAIGDTGFFRLRYVP